MDFEGLLKLMVTKKASDLFITAGVPPSIKIHGKVMPVTQRALTPEKAREVVLSVMNTKHLVICCLKCYCDIQSPCYEYGGQLQRILYYCDI